MKLPMPLLAAVLLAGCSSPHASPGPSGAGALLLGASLHRAVLAQSALHPYHFVPGAAGLNALGRRDLAILADALREHPGALSVRRGDATPELHEARVAAVLVALAEAGVARERVDLGEGLPGGAGAPAARVLKVLAKPLILTGGGATGGSGSMGQTLGSAP